MSIWGTQGKQQELSEGQFFCPHCGKETCYKLKHLSMYFTLFSIHLFKTKNVGEFVECQFCQNVFNTQFLDPERQGLFRAAAVARDLLLQGNTPEEVKAKCIAMGMQEEFADTLVVMGEHYRQMAEGNSVVSYEASVAPVQQLPV